MGGLVDIPLSRLTVARAGTTGMRFNSAGVLEAVAANTARIDYGTYTLTSTGGQDWTATPNPNMLLGPEDFGGSAWSKTAATVSNNTATAPDGTLTADKLTEDGTNAGHYLGQSFMVVAGSTYTLSLHVKPETRSQIALILTSGFNAVANQIAVFTLSGAGSYAVTSGSPACQIVARTDGSYRVSITATADTTVGAFCQLRLASGGSITYQGDGASGLYIWGAKMEIGSTATGYQPVTPACRGLLAEPTRTNSIRNPRCEGVVAGSPGTLPTNWSSTASAGPVNGITRTVVGSGTEDGIPYVDVRFSGTPTSGNQYVDVTLETSSPTAAAGQSWAVSAFLRVIAGSVSGLSPQIIAYGSPGFSDNGSVSASAVTGSPLRQQRFLLAKTFSDAGVTGISPRVALTFPSGTAGDVTLRIGLPQCELGARASSPILPPVSAPAASTRNADWPTFALSTLPSWNSSEWTLVVEHEIIGLLPSQVVAGIGSTFGASVYLSYGSATPLGWGAGYGTGVSFPTTSASVGVHRNVIAMGGTTALISADGGTTATVTGIAPPTGATMIGIGNAPWSASNSVGGYIRRLQYLPRKANSTEVRSLSGGTDITGQTVPETGNCLLSWVNHLDAAATVVSSSSYATGLGPERLKDPQARKRMRTAAGVVTPTLSVDLGSTKEVGVLAVLQPDDPGYIDADGNPVGYMASTDTIRHRLDATTAGTGALYDSQYYRDASYIAATLDLNFTAQSYREFQNDVSSGIVSGYGLSAHVLPATVQPRYWQCDVSATSLSTTPGYLDIGRLWVGSAWRPTRNFAYEWSDEWTDLSETTQVRRSGQEFVDFAPKKRVLTFGLKALTEPEAKVFMKELGRIIGTSKQVLFIQEPNGAYQGYESIIGRLVEVSPITQPNFALYERVFQIRQSL
ncbi:hypothetical protein D9623_33555 (plasmid) [Azospirillum brasilense]|uniref:Uncharacterized protein n=4 Tax=root TaxID=1 RepID=A0A4D8R6B1_AZOBR|nr:MULTISPECIES: hypothetical protein [Azospirillum]MDW7555367.1 hypothetical protein [Azospirillum brasilense]MDW7595225.1 hypothetical protein [Azospirillum brasilense]MDX5949746.1 hypothetical protein [Azospirillum brasilense]QCO12832.1 hypothetical protein D3868_27885 [Azospirillum brasilense]QEL93678.1 hypothetical protein D9621_26285 [Azospirillum brasilense]